MREEDEEELHIDLDNDVASVEKLGKGEESDSSDE